MAQAFETTAERARLMRVWGDVAVTESGREIPGQYDEPSAEALLVEARAPTFLGSLDDITAAQVSHGSTIASVRTYTGRVLGPFRIISWDRSQDGELVTMGLQSL